jgi:hypothetical protein
MSKQRPKIREENKMSEKNFRAIAEGEPIGAPLNPLAEDEMPTWTEKRTDWTEKRTRDARKLRWYERQYGAGFVSGFWVGIAVGFPLAAGVAAVCKVFVTWLFTFS